MFDYFTFRTSAAADNTAVPDEVHISPSNSPSPQRESASPPASSPTASSVDLSANPSQVPSNIENLVRRMRRQNLELEDQRIAQSPYFPASPTLSDMPSLQPCPELEIDQLPAELPSPRDGQDLSLLSLAPAPSSLTVGDPEPDPVPPVPDTKRLRRQLGSHFNNNPANAPAIHALARGLAESGSQCNVRTGPPPTPISATRLAPIIEPDDDLGLLCVDLEVDEAYCAGNEEITWLDNCTSLRRASTPGGIRKNGVLRYRLSLDAALRCNNVVRSRPRMRKRKRQGNNPPNATPSLASSDSSPSLANLAS